MNATARRCVAEMHLTRLERPTEESDEMADSTRKPLMGALTVRGKHGHHQEMREDECGYERFDDAGPEPVARSEPLEKGEVIGEPRCGRHCQSEKWDRCRRESAPDLARNTIMLRLPAPTDLLMTKKMNPMMVTSR